jgi:AcrR family transcriptional regulator
MAQRDRQQTRGKILKAVGRLLARSGFRELGINAIAREAGVDKVLIYRYFGGIPGLLRAFAEESDFWPGVQELAPDARESRAETTPAERARFALVAFCRALRSRPLTQEIMRWELLERSELTDALAQYREKQSAIYFPPFDGSKEIDIRAVGSVIAAGLTYLVLRSKTADVYHGLHLDSPEDWSRIERAAGFLVDAAFLAQGPTKPAPRLKRTRRK